MVPGPQGQQSVLHLGHATLKEGEMWRRCGVEAWPTSTDGSMEMAI